MDPFDDHRILPGSDNVFVDLGFEDSVELALRGDLARVIRDELERRQLSEEEAAQVMGIHQQEVESLLWSHLERFPSWRLFELLFALGFRAELAILRAEDNQRSLRVRVRDLTSRPDSSDSSASGDSEMAEEEPK